ncbi:hypothetical protein dqs_0624 [Azoarcus olearius]|uniref:hypothetical protein n=1 Tax=Azoarcus sp. (strain BH72) TaxID=418699 RepID=UPI00080626A5|nr:hypothetical protein [Azoarcus olearius]ANQ83700.1 hypothetical protein dqs_0624 [Azoarcus olearius]
MAALTAPRNTMERAGAVLGFPVKANAKIFAGALVVLSAGFAAPGSVATTLIAVGRADEAADNTGGADGAITVQVRRGTFKFGNSASTDLIAQADVGADCYIVDDQTVAKTNGSNTRSRAGKIVAVESDGVWVQIGLGQ